MFATTPMGPGFFIFFRDVLRGGGTRGRGPQYGVFPKSTFIEEKLGEPALRWRDIVSLKEDVEIIAENGEKYLIIEKPIPSPKQVISLLSARDLESKILKIQNEFKITKHEALQALERLAEEKLKQIEKIQLKSAYSDEELALILILSEA